MKPLTATVAVLLALAPAALGSESQESARPIGQPGTQAVYRHEPQAGLRGSVVERFTLCLGSIEQGSGGRCQWLALLATKVNGQRFGVWLLGRAFPPRTVEQATATTVRYILQEGNDPPQEFTHRFSGAPVLPSLGAGEYLWPRPRNGDFDGGIVASQASWLGHQYLLETSGRNAAFPSPPEPRRLTLLPDVLVGVPSNSRTKDNARRYDGSDYEMVRLTQDNYTEMIRAGMNCFRVDAEQAGWLKHETGVLLGDWGADVPFPECLFRSTYLGPALFLDEPAVGTRDYVIRRTSRKTRLPPFPDAADRARGVSVAFPRRRARWITDRLSERDACAHGRRRGHDEFRATEPVFLGNHDRFGGVATDG